VFPESPYFLFDGLTTCAVTGYKHDNLLCLLSPRMTHAVTEEAILASGTYRINSLLFVHFTLIINLLKVYLKNSIYIYSILYFNEIR